MIRKIVEVKQKSLREPSRPIKKLDKKVLQLIKDLKDTLKAQNDPEGVGLAGPQIGENYQIFLMSYKGVHKIVINPKVISVTEDKVVKGKVKRKSKRILEGCLSLPHFYGPIKRSYKITIEYMNEDGKVVEEEFADFFAQIVQHEMDHLRGVLFIDRILEQKAPLYHFKGEEWEEVELI